MISVRDTGRRDKQGSQRRLAHGITYAQRVRYRGERRHREATMVAYDFKCKKCGTEFEISCHMDEREAKAVCPKCGSRKVKQKLTAAFSSPPPPKY
jgi:putative FmdB family regulatory protein